MTRMQLSEDALKTALEVDSFRDAEEFLDSFGSHVSNGRQEVLRKSKSIGEDIYFVDSRCESHSVGFKTFRLIPHWVAIICCCCCCCCCSFYLAYTYTGGSCSSSASSQCSGGVCDRLTHVYPTTSHPLLSPCNVWPRNPARRNFLQHHDHLVREKGEGTSREKHRKHAPCSAGSGDKHSAACATRGKVWVFSAVGGAGYQVRPYVGLHLQSLCMVFETTRV